MIKIHIVSIVETRLNILNDLRLNTDEIILYLGSDNEIE